MPAPTDLTTHLQAFLLSFAIGLLMGIERERRPSAKAGLRTFALVCMLGTLAAMLDQLTGNHWLLPSGLLAVAALIIAPYTRQRRTEDPGTTSVAALLVCYALGAIVWHGHSQLAVMLAVLTTMLLYFKAELQGFTSRLTATELVSILQFAVLSLIILPVLPNRDFGPYGAFNPYQVWLMVVLISGVSLVGYAALRWVGARYGAPVIGLFGGLVSSTATTMVFARHARRDAALIPTAAMVVLLANLVMMGRLTVLAAVLAPELLLRIAAVIGTAMALGLIAALWQIVRTASSSHLPMPEVRNPTEMRVALTFGLIYGAVLLLSAWLNDIAGDKGLYAVSFISGLTDVDAITLSSLRLHTLARLTAEQTVVSIALAMLANLCFKFGLAASIGGAALARLILPGMGAVAAGTLIALAL